LFLKDKKINCGRKNSYKLAEITKQKD